MKLQLVKSDFFWKKFFISVFLGILGFLGSKYSIHYVLAPFEIHLQWSFIFPLIASRAYGYKYGLISGIIGFGALFPFLLWQDNGWANVVTSFVYISYFVYLGFFDFIYNKKNRTNYYSFILFVPFLIFSSLAYRYLYPIAFSMNPPFWTNNTEQYMPVSLIKSIMTKEIILLTIGFFFTNCLLKITQIRKLLGLKIYRKQEKNLSIFLFSLLSGIIVWLISLIFNQIFIIGNFPQNIFIIESSYEIIGLFLFFFSSIVLANVLMEISEYRYIISCKLKYKEFQISSISNNLQSGMIYQLVFDPKGVWQFKYLSDTVKSFYGITQEEAYKNSNLIYSKIHPNDLHLLKEAQIKGIKTFSTIKYEVRVLNIDGSYRWSSFILSPKKRDDGIVVWDGIEFIITQQKEKEKHIEYLSYHDYLTNLYNRRYYEKELMRINTKDNFPISLIMADVNGLKLTNDAFGHDAGDELLLTVANTIKNECKDIFTTARIGGDEFVVLLPKTNFEKANQLVKTIRKKLAQIKNTRSLISVSFGFHTITSIDESISNLFIQAENNMYRHKLSESTSMRNETIKLIMTTLFEKNAREQQHCERVSEICKSIGIALNLTVEEIDDLKTAGLLHDIGKIGINESILNKKGKLTKEEWNDIKRHPEIGYQIMRSIKEFSQISEYILYHHERIDGLGYPIGLQKDEIPLQSKILFIADAFDAMTSNRSYRSKKTEEFAISEIKKYIGTQFDSEISKVFIEKVLNKPF